jgi:hypothetical protein
MLLLLILVGGIDMTFPSRVRLLVAISLAALPVLANAQQEFKVDQDAIKRSVDAGVKALKASQKNNGFWIYGSEQNPTVNTFGATALAALTLLECGVPEDEECIQKAARAVRLSAIDLTHTYSLSLSILFLDRLGEKEDAPLIKSMTTRLISGQNRDGNWTYHCPRSGVNERTELINSLKSRRDQGSSGNKKDEKPADPKMVVFDLDREIEKQIGAIAGSTRPDVQLQVGPGDNSNTQFALLALWIARRHGLPVEKSLAFVDAYFRATQNPDGGWSYTPNALRVARPPFSAPTSSPAMTCAGLLGLAVGNVSVQTSLRSKGGKKEKKEAMDQKEEKGKEEKPKSEPEEKSEKTDKPRRDLSKDERVIAGLRFLGAALNQKEPLRQIPDPIVPVANQGRPLLWDHKRYYYLWSVERVAMAYGLETIGNKDWFVWGAEQLLNHQSRDGSWQGGTGDGGSHCTSFALLFLSQSNLAKDLTSAIGGRVTDPDRVVLKSGTVKPKVNETDRSPVRGKPVPQPEQIDDPQTKSPKRPGEVGTQPESAAPKGANHAAILGKELATAPPDRVDELLDQFRQAKGNDYTVSLARVIPQLEGDNKRKARQSLVDRIAEMTSETLRGKLGDSDAEIRRAACIASAMKEVRQSIPELIHLLEDSDAAVNRAAHAALKSLSNEDFGPTKNADPKDIVKAVNAWKTWWKENGSK